MRRSRWRGRRACLPGREVDDERARGPAGLLHLRAERAGERRGRGRRGEDADRAASVATEQELASRAGHYARRIVTPAVTDRRPRRDGQGRRPRRRQAQRPARAGAAARSAPSTALVLGGGGFTGGVYEIGALRALDLLSVNRTVNEFDVYVGTSAGSFVAALAANGVTPEEMMRVVDGPGADAVPRHRRSARCCARTSARPSQKAAVAPFQLAGVARNLAGQVGRLDQLTPMDLVLGLAERCPPGSTRARASRTTCARSSPTPTAPTTSACSTASSTSPPPTSTRASGSCFGAEGWDDVPISTAVRASTALPMVYKPVAGQGPRADRRRDRLDHQRRHRRRGGREVHRRRQPARALRQRLQAAIPTLRGSRPRRDLRHGLPADRLPDVQAPGLPAPARDGARSGRSATRASTSS